ncbi:MAG: phosphatidate cytidylyltransferase [Candidatus Devosia phytovorans]|uniref:Phosphatidate cytidylyltransferase n=1 Tax=Candidatus Devosia phytovorans TaxID=3121372 RepID=A0AAJ5VWY2_9HYPH|nr:phosphatidate cytidylyltransferase [Devosia sp.]WEK05922.1 MAG: phosphatidate cytidylyltransferase [Devosia sp.]
MTDQHGSAPEPQPKARRSWSDVGPRLISAAVLLALTASALYIGSYVFAAVVGAVFAGCYREWETMVTRAPLTPAGMVLIGLVAASGLVYPVFGPSGTIVVIALACAIAVGMRGEGVLWRILGLCIYGAIIIAALAMRGDSVASLSAGVIAGIYLGTVVWMTDSAAFFAGRQIGGEKLAPDISPSKTWSGAAGGLALGTGAGLLVWILATDSPWWIGLLLSATISVLGQLGDLSESAVKRHFRIKDSGDIIPGHGGLMDRLDSLTFGILLVLLVGALHGGYGAVAEGLLYW